MKEQVQSALDDIRPSLQADGGDVELVDVVAAVRQRLATPVGGRR